MWDRSMTLTSSHLRKPVWPNRQLVFSIGYISTKSGEHKRGAIQRTVCKWFRSWVGSAVAKVAQVDHRVGQGLEGVMNIADDLKTSQHATKLVLPGEHALNGAKALLEDGRTEQALGSALGGLSATRVLIDVGDHATVEDRFTVGLAIVDTIQTDNASSKINANGTGDARQLRHRLTQQWGLIAISWRCDEWRDHVAVAVAKRDHLVALEVLVPAKANVISALLGDGRGAVAVNDRGVKQVVFEKGLHRTREDGVDAAVGHPAAKGPVDARVVDFRLPICALFNRQLFPLAPQVELQQDVVEDLVQRQFDVRPSAPTRDVRQDKFIKLLETQIRWNPLPLLALRHFARQSRWILPDTVGLAQTQCSCALAANSNFLKTRNQLQHKAQRHPQPLVLRCQT